MTLTSTIITMVQCEGKNIAKPSSDLMRKNLGISLVEKLILIFLIFMSLGENFFFHLDSGASLAPTRM